MATTTHALNEVAAQPHNGRNGHGAPNDASDAVKRLAQAIAEGIHKLGIPPEAIAVGESLFGLLSTAIPLRRGARQQPGLTIAGFTALGAGIALLCVAVARSRN